MAYVSRLLRTLLLAPALVACTSGSPTAAQEPNCETRGQQVLDIVNVIRINEGLGPLLLDLRLAAAAQTHANDMAEHGFISHTGSDGSSAEERIVDQGYPWMRWAENVAAGQGDAERVVADWMDSPGHRRNILDPNLRHIGIGFASDYDSRYGTCWAMALGDADGPRDAGNGCHP